MHDRTRSGELGNSAASVVLPAPAGPSTHTRRPGRASGAGQHQRDAARRVEAGSPGAAAAAVGRHHVDDGLPESRCTSTACSNSSPDLAWRNQTRSPIAQQRAPGAGQRGLHLAGALEPGQVQAGGAHGIGAAGRRRRRRRRPVRRRGPSPSRRGLAHDGSPKNAAGRGETTVVVEEARHQQAGAGRDLGDRGSAAVASTRAGAAAVQELEVGELARAPRDSRAAASSWAIEADFSRRTTSDGRARAGSRPGRRRSGPRRSSCRRGGSPRRSTSRAQPTTSAGRSSGDRSGRRAGRPSRRPGVEVEARPGPAPPEPRVESRGRGGRRRRP